MKYAVLDFETTGSQPADEIIQVGLIIIEQDQIVDRYSSLVKPTVPIPDFISMLTGIRDEAVEQSPQLDQVMPEIVRHLEDAVLVAHQAAFDLAFLQRALDYCGYCPFAGRVLDTMDVVPILYPSLSSLALGALSQQFGIAHARPHQADSDAEATAMIWLQCLDKLEELPLITMQRLAHIFSGDTSDFGWFLMEMLAQKERSISLDPHAGTYFRQFALKAEDWGDEGPERSEELLNEKLRVPFDEFYAGLRDALSRKFERFEEREAQVRMLQEVTASFENDRHLMIEAGTGTGKSLGYLVPSLYYGIREQKKVIVSTHTINLQEQLRARDIPLLQEIFPVPFKAAVLKGRSHYLCLRKFEGKIINLGEYEGSRDDRVTAAQMVVWLGQTERGDDEELYFGGRGRDFWGGVASDADSCLNRACPWFRKCFYHRAKHDANTADVVITNHSLLFTDIRAENRILPGYKHLVVDEAHQFEDVASKHLGIDTGYLALIGHLARLYKDAKNGQLPSLRLRLARSTGAAAEKADEWCRLLDLMGEKTVEVKEHWDELALLLFEIASGSQSEGGEAGQLVHRMKDDNVPKHWDSLLLLEENIYTKLGEVLRKLERLTTELKEEEEDSLDDIHALLTDLGGTLKDLARHRDALRFFMRRTDPKFVYWMEASAFFKTKSLQLNSVPVDVSPMLRQYFFETKDSIIMTSATLSVDKKFDYTCEQLGLNPADDKEKLATVLLPSPFNYRKQALVCIPRDFPGIRGTSGDSQFIARLSDSLAEVAVQTKGRMLVLFTSYRMLKLVYAELKEKMASKGINVLGQGMDGGGRSKLTRLFRDNPSSILLGTSSFWEGVDIPGEALTCLAIVRLPFQPPNHPVAEAKSEAIKKSGGNPFMKLSVPQAVIRFKQGFGRLVRTASDRGIVIVYDTRVIDTSYGKYFLYSLPGPKIEHMPTVQLVPRIRQWMEVESLEDAQNL